MLTRTLAASALTALLMPTAAAEDISRRLRQQRTADSEAGNNTSDGLVLIINGRHQWNNGLFIENFAEDENGLMLGYNAYDWSLDVFLTRKHAGGTAEGPAGDLTSDPDNVLGVRGAGYVGDYLWQAQGWRDVSGRHDGFGASALVGRRWQLRNRNLHGLTGASCRSAGVLDYYYGANDEQALGSGLDAYEAGAGCTVSAETGVTYPLGRIRPT